ncbi:MAG TPA: hypothetical protein VGD17_14930 [Chitinophagaceae bacterium]
MKKIQAYLTGAFIFTAVLGSTAASAQQDTIPQRRDTVGKKLGDSMRSNRSWDQNNARWNENRAVTYIDLNTGDTLDYFYDSDKKIVMNRISNLPVDFYVNTVTGDTVYGRGRFIVNGFILRGEDGKWKFDENKVKIDGDELKIKDGDRKLKIDGDEMKIKDGDRKIKSDKKEAKIKDGDTKVKVDNEEMKVKDEDGKAKYKKDKTKIKDGDNKIKRKSDSTRINNENQQ